MKSNFKEADTRDETKANSMYYELLCNNGNSDYWLASRYADAKWLSCADFGLRFVFNGKMTTFYLLYSDADVRTGGARVRPVVSLPSNIINIDTDYDTEGAWKLK